MAELQPGWPAAARIVHLAGGCRAVNTAGPTVDIHPPLLGKKRARLTLPRYESLYSSLEGANLSIVGVEFYTHELEATGRMPPQWRPYHRSSSGAWPWHETDTTWSHIS